MLPLTSRLIAVAALAEGAIGATTVSITSPGPAASDVWLALGPALFTGLVALIVAVIASRQRGMSDLVDQIQEERQEERRQIVELNEQVRLLRGLVEQYRIGIYRLVRQLESHGHEPIWRPDMSEIHVMEIFLEEPGD